MSIEAVYKTNIDPNENQKKEEITSTDFDNEEDYDFYEYVLDNLFIMTKNLSEPNENVVINTLKWFYNTFYHMYYVLPPEPIIQIFNLMNSEDESISKLAFKVILWAVSFESNMQIILLENGLLPYILSNFPEKGTSSLCYQLTARSNEAREILIQNGYLEMLRSMQDPESTYVLANQLHSLVNLPMHEYAIELVSEIFDTFKIIWSNIHHEERKHMHLITVATHKLLKSNQQFLYAFMHMEIFQFFIEVPENLNEKDEPYLEELFKLLTFVINQNEHFAVMLIQNKVVDLAEEVIMNDDCIFIYANFAAMNFLSDLIFYRPEVIENIYNRGIPHCVIDMFEDIQTVGGDLIDALSFIIIMMALSSPKIFAMMKNIGCYTIVVQNVMAVESLYWKWAIRVLFRGFVVGKDEENEDNRQFLAENTDLITWLENLKNEKAIDISSAALQLLVKIFPDYVAS